VPLRTCSAEDLTGSGACAHQRKAPDVVITAGARSAGPPRDQHAIAARLELGVIDLDDGHGLEAGLGEPRRPLGFAEGAPAVSIVDDRSN
jgi:hypothetical protein